MVPQLALFSDGQEARATESLIWRQLPDEARRQLIELFAGVVLKTLEPTAEREDQDGA